MGEVKAKLEILKEDLVKYSKNKATMGKEVEPELIILRLKDILKIIEEKENAGI